jgi:hypothetical protein
MKTARSAISSDRLQESFLFEMRLQYWSKSPSRGMGCLVFSAAKPSSNMFISKPSLYRRSCNQLAWSLKPLETTRKLTMISWFAVAGLPRKEF